MRSNFRLRIHILTAGFVLFALVLATRLYFLQIVHGEEFSARADHQYVRSTQSLYDRGSIFFEDKDGRLISAATLKTGFTVAITPADIEGAERTYQSLSPLIDVEEEIFLARAAKLEDPYEEVANKVEEAAAERIEDLDLSGVNLHKERWRFYPGERLAAQTVGFVGFQGDEYSGRYGLERYYEDTLSRDTSSVYVNFFAEIFAGLGSALFDSGTKRAGDVVTSVEPSVQLFLERKLAEVSDEWNSRQTAGIIINPKNGEIYAMGVYPSFDLNAFQKEESTEVFVNPLVENIFELGSIIKALTVAVGLDSGAITADTTYVDRGSLTLDTYTISNFDGEARGRVPMQEVLNQSLNTGAAFIAAEVGNREFRDYFTSFRIGEETGIDLPNESAGLINNLESPRDIEFATASYGQGIAMTPVAAVRALSTLANGGTLITPHIAKEIQYESGLRKNISYKEGDRVLEKETSEEITRMLVEVVDEALLGGTVKLDNYSVAAKTGTAQIASPEGGYYDDRFLHSFFGYFPAYDAEYLIFFYTLEPKQVRYASQTLTHPFIDTVEFLINYYDVPPDREGVAQSI